MPASIISSSTTTPKKQKIRVVVRNANEEDWLRVNPKFDKGEIIATLDKNTLKIGDGTNKYSELPDVGGSGGDAVESVNGKTGVVVLDASDVGALSDTTVIPTTTSQLVNDSGYITGITETDVTEALGYTPVDPSDLSTVATTGDYSDLSGTPSLATVATTGDYDDLTNKPTIPVVPTNVSAFTNDAGYITGIDSADVTTALGYTPVDQSSLGTAAYTNSTDYATAEQGAKADTALQQGDDVSDLVNDAGYITGITSQNVISALGYTPADESSLATVATSGDYNDLSNKPTIPSTANMVTTNTAQDITGAKSFMVPIRGKTDQSDTSTVLIAKTLSGVQVGDSTTRLSLYGANYHPTYNGNDLALYSEVSSVQSQLNNKQNTITGAATSITSSNLSSNRALVSNASGKVGTSTVTSTELGYLSGATSNIQSQLNNKQAQIPAGTAGNVLTYSGTAGTVGSTALATVATSGSYNDLSDKPYIPAGVVVDQVYDATSQNAQSGIAVAEAVSTKQDTITDLSTIRSGAALGATAIQPADLATVATSGSYNDLSNKPTIPAAQVNSDWNSSSGVSEILNKPDLSVYALDSDVSDIQDLIPSTATDQNQLADKAFVNSSIANMAANYVTSDAQGDNFATRADLISGPYYYKGASYTPTNNDYALVESDENHNSDTTRYMYDGVQWNFQYVVNNSPLSQAQLDAINSGITAAKVTGYDSLVSNVQADWNASSGLAEILNKPTLGTAAYADSTDFATAAEGALADTAVQPGDLATVAVSGSYNDLSDKPTIPSTANLVTTNTAQDITGAKSFMVPIRGKTNSSDTSTVLIAKTLSGVQVGDSTTRLSLYGANYRPTYNSNDLAFYNDVSSKQNLITGAATSITYSNLTPNYALISNASGKVAVSTVTSTQLGYLSGVTSSVQTQLNNKQAKIPAGTAGEVVTYSGTAGTIGSTALATVATTGAYSDLTGTPTIPTVGDGTITFTQGGVTKGTFTTNQSGNTTIALDAGGGGSLPSQTGHSGEFLTTDGTDPSWGVATAVTFREWGGNE